MAMHATRTLVKSPPELWSELSDAAALARHLGEFGEIRITRTEPESVVEWEGDMASGSVRLEAAGWGTRVTLTADLPEAPEAEPVPEPRQAFFARLAWWRRAEPVVAEPEDEPRIEEDQAESALVGVLDTLGAAHHRPFSRS